MLPATKSISEKQNRNPPDDLFEPFDSAILSRDSSKIYTVAEAWIKKYLWHWIKFYRLNIAIDIDDWTLDIFEDFYNVLKNRPNEKPNFYFGVIKNGTKWKIINFLKHRSRELLLSELLDNENHRYPETLMMSTEELLRASMNTHRLRKITSTLIEYADKFYTVTEIAKALNLNKYEATELCRKYNIITVNLQSKESGLKYIQRKDDFNLPIQKAAQKWGLSVISAKAYINNSIKKEQMIKELGAFSIGFNQFYIPSLQDLERIKFKYSVLIPKGSVNNFNNKWLKYLNKNFTEEINKLELRIGKIKASPHFEKNTTTGKKLAIDYKNLTARYNTYKSFLE